MNPKRPLAVLLAMLQIGWSCWDGAIPAMAQVVGRVVVQTPGAQVSPVAAVGASVLGIQSLNASGASISPLSSGFSVSVLPSFSGPLTQALQTGRVAPVSGVVGVSKSIPLGIFPTRLDGQGIRLAPSNSVGSAAPVRSRGISRIKTISRQVGKALQLPGIKSASGGEVSKGAADNLFSALSGGTLIRSKGGIAAPMGAAYKSFGRASKTPSAWGIQSSREVRKADAAPAVEKAGLKTGETSQAKTSFLKSKAFRWGSGIAAAAATAAMFALGGSPVALAGTLGSILLSVIGFPQIVRNFQQGHEATKDLAVASTMIWFAAATLLSVVSVGQGNSLAWIAANVAGVIESMIVLGQIIRHNKDWKALKISSGIAVGGLALIGLIATQSLMPLAAWMGVTFWAAMGLLWILNWPQIQQNFNIFLKEGRAPLGIQPMYPALVAGGSLLHLFAAFATADMMWAMNAIIAIVTAGAVLAQIYTPKAANALIGPLVKVAEKIGIGKKTPADAASYMPEARKVMAKVFEGSDYAAMEGSGRDAQLAEFSRRAAALPGRGLIILEAPTAAGKSTLANELDKVLGEQGKNIKSLEVDRYYKERKDVPIGADGEPDFDLPESLLLDRVARDIKALLDGRRVELPYHDMATGKTVFDTGEYFEVGPDEILVVDSIYASHETILDAIAGHKSLNVFLAAPTAIRLARRIARDKVSRGMNAEDNLTRWAGIMNNEAKYILPLRNQADLIMNLVGASELAALPEAYAKLLAEEWARKGQDPEITRLFAERVRASIQADRSFGR